MFCLNTKTIEYVKQSHHISKTFFKKNMLASFAEKLKRIILAIRLKIGPVPHRSNAKGIEVC